MKKIYILMAILPLTLFAGLLYQMQKHDVQYKTQQFEKYDQYESKYEMFSDEEMMFECEKYNLVYDYEESQCKYLSFE